MISIIKAAATQLSFCHQTYALEKGIKHVSNLTHVEYEQNHFTQSTTGYYTIKVPNITKQRQTNKNLCSKENIFF